MSRYREIARAVLAALGINPESYDRYVAWALCEHLVGVLSTDPRITPGFFAQPDALKQFRELLEARTNRKWPQADYEAVFERVRLATRKHDRKPVTYEEYLKLLWQVPLKCSQCGRAPPEVILHVDHILPVSHGGDSKRPNLQFLCAEDNLHKSNQLEAGEPWLSLR